MHVPTGIFLLRVIDKRMPIALQCLIAAGRVCIEPTARFDGEVGGFLHRLDGEIAGRVEDKSPLTTHPGDDRRPVFVIMPPTWLALLTTVTGAASQRLLATALRLPLVARRVIEVIRFNGPFQLTMHLISTRLKVFWHN